MSERFRPVTLLAGEEHLLVLEAADAFRQRARAAGFDEREVLEVESGFDWNRLSQAGASLSLFATQRLLELRLPTGKPGKEGGEAITQYCAHPPDGTIMLITCNQWSKAHETAWVDAVRKAGEVMVFWPIKANEFADWLAQRARARARGLSLTREAIARIGERVEGNLLAAAQEIEKLALLSEGKSLDANQVDELVADSSRFDVFKLADSILLGDATRALRIVQHLRAEGDQVPGLLPWIINQAGQVARVAAALGNRTPFNVACQHEKVWSNRTAFVQAATKRGDADFWEAHWADLGRIDRIAKGREDRDGGDAWRELERWIVRVCDPRNARYMGAA